MAGSTYVKRVNDHMLPYLEKEGFKLIKTEFVEEDHVWYLRLYIDLTEAELEKRKNEPEDAGENSAAADADGDYIPAEPSAEADALLNGADEGDEAEEETEPGVNINDCVKVSRYLNKWLDKEDFISETYTLEVCSKGFLNSETE